MSRNQQPPQPKKENVSSDPGSNPEPQPQPGESTAQKLSEIKAGLHAEPETPERKPRKPYTKRRSSAIAPEPTAEELERERRFLSSVGKLNGFLLDFVVKRMYNPMPVNDAEREYASECAVDIAQMAAPVVRQWFPVIAYLSATAMIILPRTKLWEEWMADPEKQGAILDVMQTGAQKQ